MDEETKVEAPVVEETVAAPTEEVVEETKVEAPVVEETVAAPTEEVVEPTIVASEITPDATLLYKGKKVISTTVSAINGIEYQSLVLEDSSIVNLTQADYDKEVNVA